MNNKTTIRFPCKMVNNIIIRILPNFGFTEQVSMMAFKLIPTYNSDQQPASHPRALCYRLVRTSARDRSIIVHSFQRS